jgi:hypothetical protein
MKLLGSLAATATLILLTAAGSSAQDPQGATAPQVDCDSICLIFPDLAPAECSCTSGITTGTGTGGGSTGDPNVADPAAAAVIDEMRAAYREATAGIDNYTLVQTSSSEGVPLGPPALPHYEKQMVGGEPVFSQVPPDELARRQAEASGQPTAQQMLSGLSDMFGILGEGIPEGYTPTDEGEAKFIELFNAVAGTGIAQEAADEFDELANEETSEEGKNELFDKVMGMEELGKRLHITGIAPCEAFSIDETLGSVPLSGPLQCLVLWAGQEQLAGIDPGPGWELREVVVYVAGYLRDGVEPVYLKDVEWPDLQGLDVKASYDVLPVPFYTKFVLWNGSKEVVIERSSDVSVGLPGSSESFIPRVTRSRISGLRGVQEVKTEVLKILVNEGPLTQEQAAQLLLEAMQEMKN